MFFVEVVYLMSSVYCVLLCIRDFGKECFGYGSGYVNFVKFGINGVLMDI